MSTLRIFGLAAAALGLVLLAFNHLSRRRLRRVDWLMGSAVCLAISSLSLWPNVFDNFLEVFSFHRGGGQRLIGLLLFSNALTFALFYVWLGRTRRIENDLERLVRQLAKREYRKNEEGAKAAIYAVIPAFNEGDNIERVLKAMPAAVDGLTVRPLVVIDGATDHTEQVVQRMNQAAVAYTVNRGGGAALKAGYELAVEDGAEIVVTLDADGQHRPEEMERLIAPIRSGQADFVNGSRVLGTYEKDNQVRAFGVVVFNWLVSLLTWQRITDCSNGFRAIRVAELQRLELRQSQFHASEFLIEAVKKGLRVQEVPITVARRASGVSKKPKSLVYGLHFAKAIFTTWLR